MPTDPPAVAELRAAIVADAAPRCPAFACNLVKGHEGECGRARPSTAHEALVLAGRAIDAVEAERDAAVKKEGAARALLAMVRDACRGMEWSAPYQSGGLDNLRIVNAAIAAYLEGK